MSARIWLQFAVWSLGLHAVACLADSVSGDGPWWWRAWALFAMVMFSAAAVQVFRYQGTLDPNKPIRMVVHVPRGQSVTVKSP